MNFVIHVNTLEKRLFLKQTSSAVAILVYFQLIISLPMFLKPIESDLLCLCDLI